MTDLYAVTISPAAMLDLFAAKHDRTGNLPPNLAVTPGAAVPVVHSDSDGERAIELMRWGLPDPQGKGEEPVTTIGNIDAWRDSLTQAHRCLVPANAFSERHETEGEPHWFARDESRTPFAFAGIWLPAGAGDDHALFAILTAEANALIGEVRAGDMPVIVAEDDWESWLEGDTEAALALLGPAPEDFLKLVATGEERDPPESRMGYQ